MSAKKERNTGLKLDPKNWPELQHDTTIRGRKWCCGGQLSAATNRVLYYDHDGGLLVGPLPFEFDWRKETPHGEALFLESKASTGSSGSGSAGSSSGCCCLVASSLDCAFAICKMAELPMYSAKLLSKQHMCNHASVWRGFCDRLLAVCFKSRPYGRIIILDESKLCLRSIIRIDHPSQEEIMRLLHGYPLVTCIRCEDLSNRLLNGDGVYRGTYNMHRLLRCIVLVGYTRSDWILFNSSSGPAFGMNGFFKIRRSDQSGVGEFVMLPQVHP